MRTDRFTAVVMYAYGLWLGGRHPLPWYGCILAGFVIFLGLELLEHIGRRRNIPSLQDTP